MFSIDMPTVDVGTAVANSGEIGYGEFTAGEVFIPAGSSITTLTWYVAQTAGGTYVAAYNEDGTPAAVTQTVSAEKAYPIPAALDGARFLKATGNAAGTIGVSLKQW